CDGKLAYFATFLVQPSHLPGNCLAQGIFPVVICPERTHAVMILPGEFWSPGLFQWWLAGHDAITPQPLAAAGQPGTPPPPSGKALKTAMIVGGLLLGLVMSCCILSIGLRALLMFGVPHDAARAGAQA